MPDKKGAGWPRFARHSSEPGQKALRRKAQSSFAAFSGNRNRLHRLATNTSLRCQAANL